MKTETQEQKHVTSLEKNEVRKMYRLTKKAKENTLEVEKVTLEDFKRKTDNFRIKFSGLFSKDFPIHKDDILLVSVNGPGECYFARFYDGESKKTGFYFWDIEVRDSNGNRYNLGPIEKRFSVNEKKALYSLGFLELVDITDARG
jgi:hypothetical protein